MRISAAVKNFLATASKKAIALVLMALTAIPLNAQIGYGTAKRVQYGPTLPSACSPSTGDVYFLNTGAGGTVGIYQCTAENTWTVVGGQSTLGGTQIRIANGFPGAPDLGAQINAADVSLGSNPGEIWAFGGGVISTPIVASSGHVVRLFAGTYTNALGLRIAAFRMQDNSSLIGEGVQTIVQESSNAANSTPVIVCAYDLGATCSTLGPSTANIHISGIHFQGANPNIGTSLIDSVSLGNCLKCSVNDNWFDNIKSSHILIGGTSGSSFWSDGFEVSGNHFSGAGNCSVCVINGQNISIHDNFWSLHGNGAAADIDIEPNATTDHAQGIDIHDNNFDESLALQTVFCVTMQNGQFVAMGRVKIHDNLCNGGPFTTFGNPGATGTFKLTQCFGAGPGPVNTMSDVEIYNNDCRVTVQGGISLVGVNRGYIHDNTVQCTNADAISLAGSVTNSTVERNTVVTVTSPNSCGQNTKGIYLSSIVSETNANNANNIFRDNIAKATVINGAGSKAISGDLSDGSARSFGVPIGFENGILGSLKIAPVGQVTNVVSVGGAVPGCILAPQQVWFYKITAVTPYGEGPASAEASVTAGGGSGCPTFTWNKVAGATSYKLYRGATTGTEGFIATITGGAVIGSDDGTAAAGAAPPTTDSTVVVGGVEGAAPSGIASSDLVWPDSVSHCWKMNTNNAGATCIPGLAYAQTWTGTQTFAAILASTITSTTASPALTGFIRLANSNAVNIRDSANSNDLGVFSANLVNSFNNLELGNGFTSARFYPGTLYLAAGNNHSIFMEPSAFNQSFTLQGTNTTTPGQPGGDVQIISGTGNTNGGGGTLQLTAGAAGSGSAIGGPVVIGGGNGGLTGGAGGPVSIISGSASAGGSNGGDIPITQGAGNGAGTPGRFYINGLATSPAVSPASSVAFWMDSVNNVLKASYNAGSYLAFGRVVASGTATMTTAAIGAGACGTTVTVAATGSATTDRITHSYNAAPAANPAQLVISAWPTVNNVNFQYCNPTAGSITPTAATLNWGVVR
jgi:hypothetical protein